MTSNAARAIGCGHYWPRVLILALCVFYPEGAWTQSDALRVRVSAQAPGIGNEARLAALGEAQSQAVTQLLQVLVPAENHELHPALRPILRKAGEYVGATHVLRCEDNVAFTRVEADVQLSENALRHDVATLMLPRLPDKPNVLLVLGEQIANDSVPAVLPDSSVERVFARGLEQFRLKPAGVGTLETRFSQAELIRAVTGEHEAASAFASRIDTDAVVLGTAIARVGPATGGTIPSIEAQITVRILRGRDGIIMGQTATTASLLSPYPESGGEQAIEDAATRALRETVVSAILATLGRQAQDQVLLTIEKPGASERVPELLGALQGIAGVKDARLLFHDPDRCRIRLGYAGSMAELSDALWVMDMGGAALNIRSVIRREVVAVLGGEG